MTHPRPNGNPAFWCVSMPPNRREIGEPPRPVDVADLFYRGHRWFDHFKRDFRRLLYHRQSADVFSDLLSVTANGAAWLYQLLARSLLADSWLIQLIQRLLLRMMRASLEHDIRRSWEIAQSNGLMRASAGTADGESDMAKSGASRKHPQGQLRIRTAARQTSSSRPMRLIKLAASARSTFGSQSLGRERDCLGCSTTVRVASPGTGPWSLVPSARTTAQCDYDGSRAGTPRR